MPNPTSTKTLLKNTSLGKPTSISLRLNKLKNLMPTKTESENMLLNKLIKFFYKKTTET